MKLLTVIMVLALVISVFSTVSFAYKCDRTPGANEGNMKYMCSHELCGVSPYQMSCEEKGKLKKDTKLRTPSSLTDSEKEKMKEVKEKWDSKVKW